MAQGSIVDEEFDWEAAVVEIDCVFPAFVNNVDVTDAQNPTCGTLKQNKSGVDKQLSRAVRQSTLDKFVAVSEKYSGSHETCHPSSMSNRDDIDVLHSLGGIKSDIDPIAAQTWTYPVNVPLRDYQFSIVKTALFSNTLVSLPTGLGKTLIAAVVMYNYFRWFPAGKIVFTAPSRPLVMQQIEACHNIVGIPQEWTIDMTGQMNPAQRSEFWRSKRVFFVTPQVLEKDIQSGSCLKKELVCLVVDEAHRAMGNYSYCIVVREIMAVPVQLRILALTATPGSKQATIQTVIDNLHISTLEYRNENDPDVRQYTHNKNIELITVAMDRESVNVSNLLLEVITPVVQKLCNLGVFYNKDVTKLTPFEFLTARDKFRQSPPAYLAQQQYGEVEAYFGVAITLYHIYKLLFSHGIRPALEMLQQKLQQGSFARVMGRNETLWQAKSLMQQSVRRGAPNPKLLKLKEIIIGHFESKDHGDSRAIIFTNFRESVKDIMESLAMLGDAVKAMEFIGQSSGKASKGQSQKIQQAVLQKFRMGGYNTIVATSIGEEGLDIMEVDLVICFDANVSPLRMIQRMGRTGRKRDGQVVILASEGSELQGYLKKQAKGKAIGKHMHNGGINSFNFHSSPRMVPHSLQPKVQFVEMSIEKFVHRGRKSRGDVVSTDAADNELSETEINLLGKYFGSSSEEFWKPSLIAFPHYQLFPSRVYKVKHSFRTTEMLIDTLQSLQEQRATLTDLKNGLPNNEDGTSSSVCFQHVSDDTKEAELQGQRVDIGGPLDMVSEHGFHACSPSAPYNKVYPGSHGILQERNASSCHVFEGNVSLEKHNTSTAAMQDKDSQGNFQQRIASSGNFCEGDESLAKHKSPCNEPPMHETSNASNQDKETMPDIPFSNKISLHRCLFNTGFVSVSPDGRVIISFPPPLRLLNKDSSYGHFKSGNNLEEPLEISSAEHRINVTAKDSTKEKASPEVSNVCTPLNGINAIDLPEQNKVSAPDSHLVNMIDSLEQINVSTPPSFQRKYYSDAEEGELQTPPCSSKIFGNPEEVVLATPDSCYKKIPCNSNENILPPISNANASYIDFSPYLTNLAENGIVPESPLPAFSKDEHVTENSLQQPISDSVKETPSKRMFPAFGILPSSWEEPVTYLYEKDIIDHAANTGTEVWQTPEANKFVAPANVSPETLKSSNMKLKALRRNVLHDSAEKLNFESLIISRSSAVKGHSTPVVNCMSSSHSEDWRLSSADAKSVTRPPKFKRLCKYKDRAKAQVSAISSEIPHKGNTKQDIANDSLCRKLKLSKGKQHSKAGVQPFIDEEAEVSSDERVSTDDDENDSSEEASESDSFIDDRVELTAAPTQEEDMMAVYRRSLFTQSQLPEMHPLPRLCRSRVYSRNEFSDHTEMINVSADTHVESDASSVSNSSSPSLTLETDIKAFSSASEGFQHAVEDSRIIDPDCSLSDDENSNTARKRKLSFQQVNLTEKSKVPENHISSSATKRENCSSSSKQNEVVGRTFDDDFFEGLDLDALEAEAAEMARLRSNTCWGR